MSSLLMDLSGNRLEYGDKGSCQFRAGGVVDLAKPTMGEGPFVCTYNNITSMYMCKYKSVKL